MLALLESGPQLPDSDTFQLSSHGGLIDGECWTTLAGENKADLGDAVEALADALRAACERLSVDVPTRSAPDDVGDVDPMRTLRNVWWTMRRVLVACGRRVPLSVVRLGSAHWPVVKSGGTDVAAHLVNCTVSDLINLNLADAEVYTFASGLVMRALGEDDAREQLSVPCVNLVLELAGYLAGQAKTGACVALTVSDILTAMRRVMAAPGPVEEGGLRGGVMAITHLLAETKARDALLAEAVRIGVVETCVRACLADWWSSSA